jgi:hypothetical protein
MAGALPQESGLFSLVEMETADETVLIAVPMTTEIRGRTRRDSAEWAKEVFLQHKKNTKIIQARLKLSNVPIILRLNQDVFPEEQL